MEKYLPVLSKEKKIKLSLMMEEWNKYQEYIIFYEITVEEYEKEIESMTMTHEKSKMGALNNLEIPQDCFYKTK